MFSFWHKLNLSPCHGRHHQKGCRREFFFCRRPRPSLECSWIRSSLLCLHLLHGQTMWYLELISLWTNDLPVHALCLRNRTFDVSPDAPCGWVFLTIQVKCYFYREVVWFKVKHTRLVTPKDPLLLSLYLIFPLPDIIYLVINLLFLGNQK